MGSGGSNGKFDEMAMIFSGAPSGSSADLRAWTCDGFVFPRAQFWLPHVPMNTCRKKSLNESVQAV